MIAKEKSSTLRKKSFIIRSISTLSPPRSPLSSLNPFLPPFLPPPPPPSPHQTAPVNAVTFDELQGLTYLQVKGSGIANTCPVIEEGTSDLKAVKAGNYKIEKFCMEPTSFTVKEESAFKGGEPEFVKTRLMTRLTYTLDEISGAFKVDGSGNGELAEF